MIRTTHFSGKNMLICVLLSLLTVAALLTSCGKQEADTQTTEYVTWYEDATSLPLAPIIRDYVIDINNPAEVAGFSDHVFVGVVAGKGETEYLTDGYDPADVEQFGLAGDPYTPYEITVLENLKGNLKIGATVPVVKAGGPTEDGQYLDLEEGDFMPEEGQTLVLFVSVRSDGALIICSGKNNPKLLDAADAGAGYKALDIYKTIVDACANEIPFPVEMERYTAPEEYLE